MSTASRYCLALCAIFAHANFAAGQPAFQATLLSISDSRSSHEKANYLTQSTQLEIDLTGSFVKAAVGLLDVEITRALDDAGKPIEQIRRTEFTMRSSSAIGRSPNAGVPLRTTLRLRNPPRDATSFQTIQGTVTLLTTSEQNGTRVPIPNVMALAGRQVENPLLARSHIAIDVLTERQHAERDFTPFLDRVDWRNTVVLHVLDPDRRLVMVDLQAADGAPLGTNLTTGIVEATGGRMYAIVPIPRAPLPEGARLVFHLALPASLSTHEFRFDNIPLP